MYRSTPQSTTQEMEKEKEMLRDQLKLDIEGKKVSWKGLSSMDSDEESCSSENSSLETDMTQLSQ